MLSGRSSPSGHSSRARRSAPSPSRPWRECRASAARAAGAPTSPAIAIRAKTSATQSGATAPRSVSVRNGLVQAIVRRWLGVRSSPSRVLWMTTPGRGETLRRNGSSTSIGSAPEGSAPSGATSHSRVAVRCDASAPPIEATAAATRWLGRQLRSGPDRDAGEDSDVVASGVRPSPRTRRHAERDRFGTGDERLLDEVGMHPMRSAPGRSNRQSTCSAPQIRRDRLRSQS